MHESLLQSLSGPAALTALAFVCAPQSSGFNPCCTKHFRF